MSRARTRRLNYRWAEGASDTFLSSRKGQLIMLAARHAVPTMYYEREFAAAGGLISYGTDFADSYRQARLYRENPQGRKTQRPAGPAADQVRVGDQPQDREVTGHRRTARAARARRRG